MSFWIPIIKVLADTIVYHRIEGLCEATVYEYQPDEEYAVLWFSSDWSTSHEDT